MNIKTFKQGDLIVRTTPNRQGGGEGLIGKKFQFQGILNGNIYFKVTPEGAEVELLNNILETADEETVKRAKIFLKPRLVNIPFYLFDENWEYWVDPATTFGFEENEPITLPDKSLQQQIQDAIADQNFELAAKLRNQIDNSHGL